MQLHRRRPRPGPDCGQGDHDLHHRVRRHAAGAEPRLPGAVRQLRGRWRWPRWACASAGASWWLAGVRQDEERFLRTEAVQ
jgi:hypothetical protein